MKRLTLLIMFILAAMSVQAATLCSSGCDYALLENATAYLNDTADTLYINESGTYYMPSAEKSISVKLHELFP